jgi:hypothetical protein
MRDGLIIEMHVRIVTEATSVELNQHVPFTGPCNGFSHLFRWDRNNTDRALHKKQLKRRQDKERSWSLFSRAIRRGLRFGYGF